jgi:hypothetical protein
MDAKIKEGKLKELLDFEFEESKNTYFREIKYPVLLVVDKKTRYMVVKTPFGEAAFMEAHKDKFQDLIDADMVEFVKGEFDR